MQPNQWSPVPREPRQPRDWRRIAEAAPFVGFLLIGVAAWVGGLFAFIGAAILEAVGWLRDGRFPNYSLSTFFPIPGMGKWQGVQYIADWVWTLWIGLPIGIAAIVGLAVYASALSALEDMR